MVRLHTGKGTNTTHHRYWGRSWYVWNNTGDKAVLGRPDATLADTSGLVSAGLGYKDC